MRHERSGRGPAGEEDRDSLAERLAVSRETADRLIRYVDLLRAWNARINLVSRATLPAVWERHVRDSLQLLDHLDPGHVSRVLDLGSGAGFPGLVLAIAAGIETTLVEADRRKAAFLAAAIAQTGAPATVIPARIESLDPGALARPDLVTARALKPLPALLALAAPWLRDGGAELWAWKGARWREELTAARKDWIFACDALPSRTEPAARLLRITDLRPRSAEHA